MTDTTIPDEQLVGEAIGSFFTAFGGGMVTFMVDIGHRTGLFDAAARGPATSVELAQRAGCVERYVREWLGCLTSARIFSYDPASTRYTFRPEYAMCLTGEGGSNVAPSASALVYIASKVAAVAGCFRDGGGVPDSAYRPEYTDLLAQMNRFLYDGALVDGHLATVPEVTQRLRDGIRVADVGCGSGHCITLMAQAFPKSDFVGYEIATDAVAQARTEADELGLTNAHFEVSDINELPTSPPFDLITAFDVIHDLAHPDLVLRRIHDALAVGGAFLMIDVRASSDLADNLENPFAPMMYATSTLYCLTVSLAQDGMGLGTMWGEQRARQMLTDAGFSDVTVHQPPSDAFNNVYLASV